MKDSSLRGSEFAKVLAKGALGAIPFVGPLAAEVVGYVIPDLHVQRLVRLIESLNARVDRLELGDAEVERRFKEEGFVALFEEGLIQAARGLSDERREHIAGVLASALSEEELDYARARKMLTTLDRLADPEVILLKAHSLTDRDAAQAFRKRHPELLSPSRRSLGVSQQEQERGALQDSYRQNLVSLGLLEQMSGNAITPFGRMLLRFIEGEG